MNKNDQEKTKTKQKKPPNECQIKKQTSQKLIQLSINRQNTESILFLPHVQQIGRRLQVCLIPAHVSKSGRFFFHEIRLERLIKQGASPCLSLTGNITGKLTTSTSATANNTRRSRTARPADWLRKHFLSTLVRGTPLMPICSKRDVQ